ncbi:HNH endonuclease [Herbaspirillum rhizosphaerae]|uniref:HNH endonuclease n=1 Tax=Herbaspirillum rhizosphaerae TaxID=346179 RepID=UPI0009FAD3F1|nr:HNH endonuclease [Herbaspirillum rhizosphaerae]
MLWLPVTPGEQLFLYLFERLGHKLSFQWTTEAGIDSMDFLFNPVRFQEFTQLSVSLEVFLRAIRSARAIYAQAPNTNPSDFARTIRRDLDLPSTFTNDKNFGEIAKRAGRVAHEVARDTGLEKSVLRAERKQCYLCGEKLDQAHNPRSKSSIEHIWPLSLGGETVESNLIPACKDCNDKRQHMVTWAWGPVQSTFEELTTSDTNPNGAVRLSLGLGKIMLKAQGIEGKPNTKTTLKEAAQHVWPAIPGLKLKTKHSYIYFEYFQEMENTL